MYFTGHASPVECFSEVYVHARMLRESAHCSGISLEQCLHSLSALLDDAAETEEAVAAALACTSPRLVLLPSGLTKLISKQSTAANWGKALLVYKLLSRFDIEADLPLFNAALGACEAGRSAHHALEVLADLKAAGCQPDSITFKVLAATCAKAKDWRACVTVRIMSQHHCLDASCTHLLRACVVEADSCPLEALPVAGCIQCQWLSSTLPVASD